MKRTAMKKLVLRKETVRSLGADALQRVGGAMLTGSCGGSCGDCVPYTTGDTCKKTDTCNCPGTLYKTCDTYTCY